MHDSIWTGCAERWGMRMQTRGRDFLKSSGATCVSAFAAGPLATFRLTAQPTITKGLVFDMVPGKLSYADRFKLVRDAGFEVVQALTEPDQRKAEALKQAADAARIRIDSDRKSTRLNSSHGYISYAVFCLKKKTRSSTLSTQRLSAS